MNNLKNQIIDWLKEYEYWFQYASSKLLEGDDITDVLISMTYKLFKEDNNLKPIDDNRLDIKFSPDSFDTNTDKQLKLLEIKNIENVNALASGQSILIDPNLTIVYGGNGTGKSGYVRLLNRAFVSRGDKNILPNVFYNNNNSEPCCKFIFQTLGEPYEILYPGDKDKVEFSQFSVFDSLSSNTILTEDNKLNFTPKGFDFFEKVLALFNALKTKLQDEITKNKPHNEFIDYFTHENAIKEFVLNLGDKTEIKDIERLGNFTPKDNEHLDDLKSKKEKLKSLNIPEKISELQKIGGQLDDFTKKQKLILDYLQPEYIKRIANLITKYNEIENLSKNEGIINLEKYNINELASKEWKEFILASKKYAELIESNRNQEDYPYEEDDCLFCLRPLNKNSIDLINIYWKLLKSEAEKNFNIIAKTKNELINKLETIEYPEFNDTTTLYNFIYNIDTKFANNWKDIVSHSISEIKNIISNLKNCNLELKTNSISINITEFNKYKEYIENEIKSLIDKNPSKEIEEIDTEIQFLTDKSLFNKLLKQIISFVESHNWASKAEKSLLKLNTKSVTIKQGELFTTHITDLYTNTFNTECKHLNAPQIVNIIQKNVKISTLRKLQISGIEANSILSEGEQKAISLADFLTETLLNPNNKGVIFDDPVTSQDHLRKEKIAERLVKLSEQKQVVIFTHDIAFFIRLNNLADKYKISHSLTTMRTDGKTAGIINPDLPWIAQNVKDRAKTLKSKLVKLREIEKSGTEDEYIFATKGWYILLREAWERAVEERLFKGVVERFNLGIQTQRLKKVIITDEFINDIDNGMTESSKWLHDSASGLNPTPPDTKKAENDLIFLETC